MKSIKNLFAAGLMLMLTFNLATAQRGNNGNHAEARAQRQADHMAKMLSLSETQTKQVADIHLNYVEKMKAASQEANDREEHAEVMQNMRAEREAAIKAVLTPEQLKKYEERSGYGKKGKNARSDNGRKMGSPEERAARQTERMKAQLALSDEQAEKVKAIHVEYAQKMESVKNSAEDKNARGEAFTNLRMEKMDAIKAVLTPEQIEMFEGKNGRMNRGKNGSANGKSRAEWRNTENGAQKRAEYQTRKMTKELSLSEEQASKIMDINLSFGEKMQAARTASKDKTAVSDSLKALRMEHKNAIKAVLTPEQLTKFEAHDGEKSKKHGKRKH